MTTPFPFVSGAVLTAAQMNAITTLPINDQTDDYTLVVGDVGKRVVMNKATANTVTVDDSIFGVSDTIFIANKGAGVTTVTAGAGVTINSASGLALVQNQSGQLVALSASSFLFVASAAAGGVASFTEYQASGTAGGASVSGSFIKRTLNTTLTNTITGCTLTSSVIALPAGTYTIEVTSAFTAPNELQIKLRNTTDSTDTIFGVNEYMPSNGVTASLSGSFTIAATKNFEIQYRVGTAKAGDGLGINLNYTTSNCYTSCTITKVA